MATDPRRALIVMACVLAVAVGGVALSATSYGDVPGSDVDVTGSSDSAEIGGFPDLPIGESESGSDDGSDPAETDTSTRENAETPPPEDTATPGGDRNDLDDGENGVGLVSMLLIVGFVVVVGLGLTAASIKHTTTGSKLVGVGGAGRFGGLPDIEIPNPLRAIAARVTAVTLSAPRAAGRLGHAVQEAVVGTGSALGSAVAALGRAGRMQASALGALVSTFGGAGAGLSTSLSDLTPQFGRDDLQEARPAVSGSGGDTSGEEDRSRLSVAEAWAEMRRFVSISNVSARTPAEVARAAVNQGLPRGPVMRLTETFREVTYGRGNPEGIRETAVAALRSVRDAIGGED